MAILPSTGISISLVKSALGETSNAVSKLCTSPLINKWSVSKPGRTVYNYSTELYDYTIDTAPYSLGDFRGYDHLAIAPLTFSSFSVTGQTADLPVSLAVSANIHANGVPIIAIASFQYIRLDAYVDGVFKVSSTVRTITTSSDINISLSVPVSDTTAHILSTKIVYVLPDGTGGYDLLGTSEAGFTTTAFQCHNPVYTIINFKITSYVNYGNTVDYTCLVSVTYAGTGTPAGQLYLRGAITGGASKDQLLGNSGATASFSNQVFSFQPSTSAFTGSLYIYLVLKVGSFELVLGSAYHAVILTGHAT